ncbi:MAG: hypothetical protein ACI4UK_10470 [Floccifex sp.]
MMFGFQTEVFEDTKSRKILLDKKNKVTYLLPEKGEGKAQMLKMNIVNSIAISFLAGYFLNFKIWMYIALTLVLYAGYLWFFNKRFIPTLEKVKKAEKKKEIEKRNDKVFPFVSLGYLAVGLGLVYCLVTKQVEEGMMTYIVIGAIAICAINVLYHWMTYFKEG